MPAYPVTERTPGVIPESRLGWGFQSGPTSLSQPQLVRQPPVFANPSPTGRQMTPQEWAVGKTNTEIAQHITRDLGGWDNLTPEERRVWGDLVSAATPPLPELAQPTGETLREQAIRLGVPVGQEGSVTSGGPASDIRVADVPASDRPAPTLVDMPTPPPGYSQTPAADRPAPPPGYAPANGGIATPSFRAPTVVSNTDWFTQQFGRAPAQEEDPGYVDIVRHALDPRGWEAMTNANRTSYQEAVDAYNEARAGRPLNQKIGDWTRQLLQGLTFGTADDLLGLVAGFQAALTGGDFEEARRIRTEWENQQQAAFTAENPVLATGLEVAGAIPTSAFGAGYAARGTTLGSKLARGTAVAGAEGFGYGFGATQGNLNQRMEGGALAALFASGASMAIPIVAPIFAKTTAAIYGTVRHPWQTLVTGRTAPAAGVVPATRTAAAEEFGVQLTRGQATGNVAQQAREQMMLNAGRGDYAQRTMDAMFTSQNDAVRRAAERIGVQLSDPAGQVMTAREVGQAMTERLSRIAQTAKTTAQRFYRRAEELNPVIAPETAEFVPQNVAAHMANDYPDFMFDATLQPTAYRALAEIDKLPTYGRYAEGGVVPLTEIRRVQRRLNALEATNATDATALRFVRQAYDDSISDMIDAQLFAGDDRAIAMMREGNQFYSQYLSLTRPKSGDQVGRFISQIIEGNKAPEDIAQWLYGANLTRPTGTSVRAAERLKDIVGADSQEWAALRGSMFLRLISATDNIDDVMTAGRMADNITNFVAGRGSGLAATLYTKSERDLMRRFANTLRILIPDAAATNPSRTASKVMGALTPYMSGLSTMLGFTLTGNWMGALVGLIGQPAARVSATRIAVMRALNPNAAQPFLQNPEAASRALSTVLGTANILATPRLTQ